MPRKMRRPFCICIVEGGLPLFPDLYEFEGIPDLVIEVASLLVAAFIPQKVISCRGGDHDPEAACVCAVAVDEFKQVG